MIYLDLSLIIQTGAVIFVCACLSIIGRATARLPNTPNGYISRSYVRFFMDLVEQSCGREALRHTLFIASLFSFILICNTISLIPGLHEPTENLNTTLALALISFCYVTIQSIRSVGIKNYLAEYFQPFFFLFPLHVLGKISSIVSLACRLFGNIYGGTIIVQMLKKAVSGSIIAHLLCLCTGFSLLVTLFFIVFEGIIQAFVFSILTLTYLSMGIVQEEHE